MKSAIQLSPEDSVCTALQDVLPGEEVRVMDATRQLAGVLISADGAERGHKLALADIPQGKRVLKYGRCIGTASQPISRGARVHTHNLESRRGRGDLYGV